MNMNMNMKLELPRKYQYGIDIVWYWYLTYSQNQNRSSFWSECHIPLLFLTFTCVVVVVVSCEVLIQEDRYSDIIIPRWYSFAREWYVVKMKTKTASKGKDTNTNTILKRGPDMVDLVKVKRGGF